MWTPGVLASVFQYRNATTLDDPHSQISIFVGDLGRRWFLRRGICTTPRSITRSDRLFLEKGQHVGYDLICRSLHFHLDRVISRVPTRKIHCREAFRVEPAEPSPRKMDVNSGSERADSADQSRVIMTLAVHGTIGTHMHVADTYGGGVSFWSTSITAMEIRCITGSEWDASATERLW